MAEVQLNVIMNSIVDFCRFLGQRDDNNKTKLRMELIDVTSLLRIVCRIMPQSTSAPSF